MTPALRRIVDRAETLAQDLDLAAVQAWKTEAPGRLAIGYMPIAVPREIVHAAGMLPVGIVGGGDRLEIIRGDAYFQSYICHIPRSTIELALSGRLDALDGMLFPSICDVIRNLSGIWQLLFPGRYVRYVDVPQNFSAEVGGRYWRFELEALAADFARLTGRATDSADLRASIAVYNDNRQAIRDLYAARAAAPWSFPVAEMYQVIRAGLLLPPEAHTALLRDYLNEAPRDPERRDEDRSRVVLVGMFCEQPPLGLLLTLERAGCWVVDDDLMLGLRAVIGVKGALDSCDEMRGETPDSTIHTRALGCLTASRPPRCSAPELSFLNDNLPVWTVRKGRFQAVRLGPEAECKDARKLFAVKAP